MSHERLLNTLSSGLVVRYHAAPTVLPKQTVAAHAWGVQVILLRIADIVTAPLLLEALLHDSGELITGDIPYTFKRDNPEIRATLHAAEDAARRDNILSHRGYALTEREQALLKIADTLEGLHYCTENEPRKVVHRRWVDAYVHARNKFGPLLTKTEWGRADNLYNHCRNLPIPYDNE